MNNKISEAVIWERRKAIYAKFNSIAQHFRNFTLPTTLITILIFSLFGCAQATPIVIPTPVRTEIIRSATASTSSSTPTQATTPVPTETALTPQTTLKIAVHVPLSGGRSSEGQEAFLAAQLAVRQLSGPLHELGYGIDLVSFDDQAIAEVGRENAREIVADQEILCGMGHYNSNVMIQASEIYHTAGLAFVSPAATRSTVTDRYYPEVNRLVGRDDGQGIAAAQFVNAQGFTRVFVVRNNDATNKKSADYFTRHAYLLGTSVVRIIPTEQEANFTGIIRHVLASDPEIVYLATSAEQAGAFIREARAAGYMGAFIGTENVNKPDLAQLAGPALTNGGGMYYTTTVVSADAYTNAAQFALDFVSTFGSVPRPYAAQAYDAIGICLKGIEDATKAKGGAVPTRKDVANAIRAIQDYPGVSGQYRFDNKGDIVPAQYFVYEVVSADPDLWYQNTIIATFNIEPP